MASRTVTRRLTAILASDVVGYSRLVERDETGTLAALKAHRSDLLEPCIAAHQGRVVKLMGDGALVEFASVFDAVDCAIEIQRGMQARNAAIPEERRIALRIGIHLGDVIIEDDDIYGDGVNLAARLEALATPNGICISGDVYRQVHNKLDATFEDLGARRVKNIAEPLQVYRVRIGEAPPSAPDGAAALHQEIKFCTASDGVRIAYAVVGRGPPLVKAPNWLNHLEYDWESPVWRHLLHALASRHRLVRFDERGNGLSDWDVEDISLEAFVRDLEAVADAAGLDRFPLLGISQGCATSIAYAVRHPERVSRLVLYGGFARGRYCRGSPGEAEKASAMVTLIRQGWGQENPAFRQFFTSSFLPEGSPEQMQWFNDLQKITTSAENAARIREACDRIDVTELLPRIAVPTLVVHCRDDAVQPFDEGRRMAAMIPDARFVALEGRNHLMLDHEPAWTRFRRELEDFLGAEQDAVAG